MPVATDETLNEIMGTPSVPVDDTKTADQDPKAGDGADDKQAADKGQDAKGAADSPQDDDQHVDDGGDDPKDADGAKADDVQKGADDGKKEPYHKDPLNQRLKAERDKAREDRDAVRAERDLLRESIAKLEGKVEALLAGKGGVSETQLPDVLNMTAEEIEELQAKDPKKFVGLLTEKIQAEVEAKQKATQAEKTTQEKQQRLKEYYQRYADENPTFETYWKDGSIEKYIAEYPGHTPISAHTVLTFDARVNAEVEKQVAIKAKEIEKNLLAKKAAGTLGKESAPGRKAAETEGNKGFEDTKKGGGFTSMMADKLRRMRAGAT